MTQEAVENRLVGETQEPEYVSLDWDELVSAIKKSPNLLTPQKETVIDLLETLAVDSFAEKVDAFEDFRVKVKGTLEYDRLSCKTEGLESEGVNLVREILRRVLGVNYDHLTPLERREIEDILDEFPTEHEVDDSPIREALDNLEKRLAEINQVNQEQESNTPKTT